MTAIAFTSRAYLEPVEVYRFLRRNLSPIAAIFSFISIGWKHSIIASAFAEGGWKIDAYYTAVFNWSAFQGAFLFSVYAFFLSRSEPFIKAVSKTAVFRELRRYILRSLWLSMTLTFISLPAVVIAPKVKTDGTIFDPGFIVFWFVTSLFVYGFANFIKVVRVFRLLEGLEGK